MTAMANGTDDEETITVEVTKEDLEAIRDVLAFAHGRLRSEPDYLTLREQADRSADALGLDLDPFEENREIRTDGGEEDEHRLRETDREPVVMGGDRVEGVEEVSYDCPVPGCSVPISRHEREGEFDAPPEHPETVEVVPTPETAAFMDALADGDEDDEDLRTDGGSDEGAAEEIDTLGRARSFRQTVREASTDELKELFGPLMSEARGRGGPVESVRMLYDLDEDLSVERYRLVALQRGSYVASDQTKKYEFTATVPADSFLSYEDLRENVLYSLGEMIGYLERRAGDRDSGPTAARRSNLTRTDTTPSPQRNRTRFGGGDLPTAGRTGASTRLSNRRART